LLKKIAASALMIFFEKDSIFLTILLMVGGSWKPGESSGELNLCQRRSSMKRLLSPLTIHRYIST
jgi:hypothetical protein